MFSWISIINKYVFGISIFGVLVGLSLLLAFLPLQLGFINSNQSIQTDLNLKIQTLENTEILLADFAGKPIVIDFFATWCAPCKVQEQILQDIAQINPDITILSIDVFPPDSINDLTVYKQEHNITWFLGRDLDNKADALFGTSRLPTVAFIDETGRLIQLEHQLVAGETIQGWIDGIYSDTTANELIIVSPIGELSISTAIGLPLFFMVGLFVALSPCLFPIMPLTIFHILNKSSKTENFIDSEIQNENSTGFERKKAIGWVTALWSGILFSFILFALIGVVIGSFLIQHFILLNFLFGLLLLTFGIIILVPKLEEQTFARIPIPNKAQRLLQKESFSNFDLFALGSGYSFIALPCAGPIFLVILPLIIGNTDPLFTLGAISLFGLGLYLPYFALIMVTTEARIHFISFIRDRYYIVKGFTAVLIIVMGGLLMWPFFGGPILFSLA